MGTKKGQVRKTARRAYTPKAPRKVYRMTLMNNAADGLLRTYDRREGPQTWMDTAFRIRKAKGPYSQWGPPTKLRFWKK
jgi:hypothetical protein